MSYAKKTFILKGSAQGTLTLERKERTTYRLEWARGKVDGPVYLFLSPAQWIKKPASSGDLEADLEQICAIAVGDSWQIRGQSGSFDWSRALAERQRTQMRQAQSSQSTAQKQPASGSPSHPVPKERQTPRMQPQPAPGASAAQGKTINSAPVSPFAGNQRIYPGASGRLMQANVQPGRHPSAAAWQAAWPPPVLQQAEQPAPWCPACTQVSQVSPFEHVFPESRWLKHEYPGMGGRWHYLTGEIFAAGKRFATAVAVPGSYGLQPPAWLKGFDLYLAGFGGAQGYWVNLVRL